MLRYWFNTVNRLPPVPRDSRVILSDLCNKAELLKQKIVQEMTHTCATLDNYIIHGTALFFPDTTTKVLPKFSPFQKNMFVNMDVQLR